MVKATEFIIHGPGCWKTKCKFAAQLRFWSGLFPGLQTDALPLCPQMVFPWCTVHEKEEIHCAPSFFFTRLEPGPHPYNFFKHYIFSTSAFNTEILRTRYSSACGSCCLASHLFPTKFSSVYIGSVKYLLSSAKDYSLFSWSRLHFYSGNHKPRHYFESWYLSKAIRELVWVMDPCWFQRWRLRVLERDSVSRNKQLSNCPSVWIFNEGATGRRIWGIKLSLLRVV